VSRNVARLLSVAFETRLQVEVGRQRLAQLDLGDRLLDGRERGFQRVDGLGWSRSGRGRGAGQTRHEQHDVGECDETRLHGNSLAALARKRRASAQRQKTREGRVA
jgi:hypothetical protein